MRCSGCGKHVRTWMLVLVALGGAPTVLAAPAGNAPFYADMPIARFTAAQKRLHRAMLEDLLNKGANGDTRRWATEDERIGGEARVEDAEGKNGLRCRELEVRSWHIAMKATNTFLACQIKDGTWKLAN